MRLDSLKHIVRSVHTMMEAERVVVFESASFLASFPELGENPESPLQLTYDADLIPYPFEEGVGTMLDEAFGEDRGFHQRYGYHADIVRPKITETFPSGWEERLLSMDDLEKVFFLEPHDVAAVKCIAGREKNGKQLSYLIRFELVDVVKIRSRMDQIQASVSVISKSHEFLTGVIGQSG